MKKLLVLTVISILGFSNSLTAQEVNFGIKGGLNVSDLQGTTDDRNNIVSFHAGAFAEFKLSNKFSIQPELLYSRQGSESNNQFKFKLDYITLPVMLKYYVAENVSIDFGPQVSFLVNDKVDANDSSFEDLGTDAETTDFGLNVGFGYNINSHLLVQLRYNFGISSVAPSSNPITLRTRVFQASLGYRF